RQFYAVDDELIARSARIGRDPADADDLEPVFGRNRQPRGAGAPATGVEHRLIVLEAEVEMSGAGALEPGDLTAHAHLAEIGLERALDRSADLADRVFGHVRKQGGGGFLVHRGG